MMAEGTLPSKQIRALEWLGMRQALRFAVALVAGLALLTWGASVVVDRTTRDWFERDMLLRAELAARGRTRLSCRTGARATGRSCARSSSR